MAKQLACEGMAELESIIAKEGPTSKNIVVLFTGKVDPTTGESWCPDCVKADPIIEKCVPKIPAGNSLTTTSIWQFHVIFNSLN